MLGDRVRADDHVTDISDVECGKQIEEVAIQDRPLGRGLRIARPRAPTRLVRVVRRESDPRSARRRLPPPPQPQVPDRLATPSSRERLDGCRVHDSKIAWEAPDLRGPAGALRT